MEIVKPDTYIDFMRFQTPAFLVSAVLIVASIVLAFVPGPNYGIDFEGGTEIQLRFQGDISSSELRQTLQGLGYGSPDVVRVEGEKNEYMLRIQEMTSISEADAAKIRQGVEKELGAQSLSLRTFRVSPGGDKVTVALKEGDITPSALSTMLESNGMRVRAVDRFGRDGEQRFEAQLIGVADKLVAQLKSKLGSRGPEEPKRIEWVGPKAGEQLRDAAVKSLLYAIAFIMVYVAFRFDLRFAPGAVVALLHDSIITLGVFVVLQKQVNLTTVASLLTIIGYSINDTIVVFDRIRENMAKLRKVSMRELINVSTSQMLSRTIVTSGTTMLSVSAFFFWGTEVIRDIAFALVVGIFVGTYSSIYVAAPVTEWMDRKLFRRGNRALA